MQAIDKEHVLSVYSFIAKDLAEVISVLYI